MAMPKEKTLTAMSELLKTLRYNSRKHTCPSALQVEVMLQVAIKPRTYEELATLTNTNNGSIARVVERMTPRVGKDGLIRPDIHLLNRKFVQTAKVGAPKYQVSLSKTGEDLMKQVGLA
tara:strand:+ start:3270 stop:3626 length:357 start_codon:yes stop_codon:yes gene_type:complete